RLSGVSLQARALPVQQEREPGGSRHSINCPATRRSAAVARHDVAVFWKIVVEQQLGPRFDIANAHHPRLPTIDPELAIRLAAVIDQFRAASAYRSVQRPIFVEAQEI